MTKLPTEPDVYTPVVDVVQRWAVALDWTQEQQTLALCTYLGTAYANDDEEKHRYSHAQSFHRWLVSRIDMVGRVDLGGQ